MAAYKEKFVYEEKAQVEQLDEIDCSNKKQHVAECKYAQHQMNSIRGLTRASAAIMDLIHLLLNASSAGFAVSFFLQPLFFPLKTIKAQPASEKLHCCHPSSVATPCKP